MKKTILTLAITIFTILLSFSQEKLKINTTKSKIKWIGEYTFYFGGHDGNINFKEGYFIKKNDVIIGGEFIIDMNSITNTDIEAGSAGNINLVNHLKNEDFFDVKKHPLATLKITKIEYHDKISARLEADLTLKGITKSINFQVKFDYEEKEMKTRFKIDRKKWNVNYESKFKDSAISDAIGFEVSIKL
jgi:polyisoprenoid-binding protein YceI